MNKLIPALAALTLFTASSAIAQTSPSSEPSQTAPGATQVTPPLDAAPKAAQSKSMDQTGAADSKLMMTDAQAQAWINKSVYSSDNQNLGEVAAIKRDQAGNVTELHADIGGFLGLGETRVRVLPNQFEVAGDRILLDMTGDQAKSLPHIAK